MTTPPRQTYADLATEADVVGTDLIATWRSTGPLKTVTGAILSDYIETALGLGTMATQDADSVAITGGTIDGTAITDGSINVPAITLAGGTAIVDAPLVVATQTWNEGTTVFTALDVNVTDTASNATSRFHDYQIAGNSIHRVLKTGETIISNAAGTSLGGMKRTGNAGEMALTSLIDPSTGGPAEVLRWYWENSTQVGANDPNSAAVIRGFGGNRFSVESGAALVHIAANGRFEWEGLVSDRLLFVGYEAGSSIGKTFDFNNSGQTPTQADQVMSISTTNAAKKLLQFCSLSGSTYTELGNVSGAGVLNMPSAVFTGNAQAANVIVDTQVSAARGTTGAPAYSFTGDLDVGMWSPSANVLAFSTTGTEAIRIHGSRNVSIGNTTDSDKLSVTGDIRASNRYYGVGTTAYVQLDDGVGARIAYGNAVLNVGGPVVFSNSGTERFRVSNSTGDVTATGSLQMLSGTAVPAGGTAGAGLKVSSTSNFGVFFGSGAPTLSAAKGSLYLRSDGSGINDRMYVNTNGTTTWTAVVTVA